MAEIGVDLSRLRTAGHMASWAGMAPGNNITGGKRHSGMTTKGEVWLREVLIQSALAAAPTRDTYLPAQFWRLAKRLGKKKTAVTVVHSILVICWYLLPNVSDYIDLGGNYFTRRRDADRHQQHLLRQL